MNKRSETWHQELVHNVLSRPEGLAEYNAFKTQLELADKLKAARLKAHITQEKVAEKMATTKSVIARLESAGGKAKHSPSLATLTRYANAIGYDLKISLTRHKHT